jgi:hypothetical protein
MMVKEGRVIGVSKSPLELVPSDNDGMEDNQGDDRYTIWICMVFFIINLTSIDMEPLDSSHMT